MRNTPNKLRNFLPRHPMLAFTALLLLLAVLFLANFRLFVTDGPSMKPTYEQGDILLSVRLYGQPKTGDVVLIQKDGTTYMKRVAFVAGEDVSQSGYEGYWGSPTVPEGYVYVLGDNADNSYDSRYEDFGLVKISEIWGNPLSQRDKS